MAMYVASVMATIPPWLPVTGESLFLCHLGDWFLVWGADDDIIFIILLIDLIIQLV